jgi:hypothetical protein
MSECQFRQRAIPILGVNMADACQTWALETLLQRLRKAGPSGQRLRTLFLQSYGR